MTNFKIIFTGYKNNTSKSKFAVNRSSHDRYYHLLMYKKNTMNRNYSIRFLMCATFSNLFKEYCGKVSVLISFYGFYFTYYSTISFEDDIIPTYRSLTNLLNIFNKNVFLLCVCLLESEVEIYVLPILT